MDMRSAEQADQVLATGDEALEVNSGGRGPVSAEWMIGKALWIKQQEPEVYKVYGGEACLLSHIALCLMHICLNLCSRNGVCM